ncbi:GSCOCG00006352001-RA-CDS [Cotesia congregata]|uniref:Uncharacterized protein n=1 Tax=Cotesia congregata TaxID=51543 RepID=A0A8J2MN52_COTCN|nr:GSCOCG00006352001-RA-CDS [Cotesia congregata]CAG5096320.1 Protein of unknown function [Cotesia congregata]
MYRTVIILVVISAVYGGPLEPTTQQPQFAEGTKIQQTPSLVTYEPLPLNNYYPAYPEYKPVQSDNTQLVPSTPSSSSYNWLSTIITSLVPIRSFALFYGARAFGYFFQFTALFVAGLAITTSLCIFTPVCSITFSGLNLDKKEVKQQVSELARAFMTQDNLDAATIFVHRAIQKYYQLQNAGAK